MEKRSEQLCTVTWLMWTVWYHRVPSATDGPWYNMHEHHTRMSLWCLSGLYLYWMDCSCNGTEHHCNITQRIWVWCSIPSLFTLFGDNNARAPYFIVIFPHKASHTFSSVARIKSGFLRPGAAADAKQPRQDDKCKKHRRESQGDLLWCWQNHGPGNTEETDCATSDESPGQMQKSSRKRNI